MTKAKQWKFCPVCGKRFQTAHPATQGGRAKIYHSNACRQKAYRERKKYRAKLARAHWPQS